MRHSEAGYGAPGRSDLARVAGRLAAAVAGLALATTAAPLYAQQQQNQQHENHAGHGAGAAPKDPKMAPESQQSMTQAMMQDVRQLRASKGDDRERTFLTKMMDHHQSGIDMARLAVEKAQSPALRAEARQIIDDQTKEIGQMREHLASAHKINRTAKPDPRMQPAMEKLRRLSGAEFDRAFVQEMSMHHQGAIDMSAVVVEGGVPHRPVRALAQKVIQGNRKSQQDLKKAIAYQTRAGRRPAHDRSVPAAPGTSLPERRPGGAS